MCVCGGGGGGVTIGVCLRIRLSLGAGFKGCCTVVAGLVKGLLQAGAHRKLPPPLPLSPVMFGMWFDNPSLVKVIPSLVTEAESAD